MWMRLRKVPWADYEAAPASKKPVPRILEALASRKGARAMKAGHDAWVALCSTRVWPAAVPAFPFLAEILGIAQPEVQGEILDLFLQFATVPNDDGGEHWHKRLHALLGGQRRLIAGLSRSRDEAVAEKARRLLASL